MATLTGALSTLASLSKRGKCFAGVQRVKGLHAQWAACLSDTMRQTDTKAERESDRRERESVGADSKQLVLLPLVLSCGLACIDCALCMLATCAGATDDASWITMESWLACFCFH